ncbi:MAG: hypothetical protein ONB24_07335 [candidate division KSB1 bacterium]|nr:hypothetical protein [candidate division KSB1 bacterium]
MGTNSIAPFDYCILTAANEAQASGYRRQVEEKLQQSLPVRNIQVIPDPMGKRIGSGGSTFYVLEQLHRLLGENLFAQRILILHSGGDSRRLPAYAAMGKLFTPLPSPDYDCLFDIMVRSYAELPCASGGQVIVASGDVLLNFDPSMVNFHPTGITGVAFSENAQHGRYFGVYVVREPSTRATVVADVLQKPSMEELEAAGAVDFSRRIWLDTGILNLSADAVHTLLDCRELIRSFAQGQLDLNLYHEILYAVCGKADIPDGDKLREIALYVSCLPYCGFYHVGRSEEFLHNFYSLTQASALYRFTNGVRSNAALFPELKSAWVYNAEITSRKLAVEKPCLIEGSLLDSPVELSGENILNNIPEGTGPIRLKKGNCLTVLPIQSGKWVAILYGIQDSFKSDDARYLNRPFAEFLASCNLGDLRANQGNLWDAALFPIDSTPFAAVQAVLSLQEGKPSAEWLKSERLSLKEIMLSIDYDRLLEHRCEIRRRRRLADFKSELEQDKISFNDLKDLLDNESKRKTAVNILKDFKGSPLQEARAKLWLASLYKETGSEEEADLYYEESFQRIRDAVNLGLACLPLTPGRPIRSDEVVWVLLPARLDFAGGWTDTPPICLERGGCVLNASITLNGQYPIQVVAKRPADDRLIGINSIDLGKRAVVRSLEELRRFEDPSDWLSLPKAALFAAGLIPLDFQGSLAEALMPYGGGIDLTLFSALPAGSGLGTSSILGAGIIAALARLCGRTLPREEIYARTSILEQLMTTGGGWQDQIGGVAGGVKLITTQPGYDQTPSLSWTHLTSPSEQLDERFLLYYTGYRRMAKNLLRQVVGRYLRREQEALQVLDELSSLAKEMKENLDHRFIDEFGKNIHRAWELNKTLDNGQTTPEIEAVIHRIKDWIFGAKLLGAGGGGFLFIVAKDSQAAANIRRELIVAPPNDRARFFDFQIDELGMRISVL